MPAQQDYAISLSSSPKATALLQQRRPQDHRDRRDHLSNVGKIPKKGAKKKPREMAGPSLWRSVVLAIWSRFSTRGWSHTGLVSPHGTHAVHFVHFVRLCGTTGSCGAVWAARCSRCARGVRCGLTCAGGSSARLHAAGFLRQRERAWEREGGSECDCCKFHLRSFACGQGPTALATWRSNNSFSLQRDRSRQAAHISQSEPCGSFLDPETTKPSELALATDTRQLPARSKAHRADQIPAAASSIRTDAGTRSRSRPLKSVVALRPPRRSREHGERQFECR